MATEIFDGPMPAHWAAYLINGDADTLDDAEAERVDAYVESLRGDAKYIDITIDAEAEPYFSWAFEIYGGDARGGDLLDYTIIIN